MTALPSGVVTFLFSDVEGSTRLWEQHAASMAIALPRHDELVRAAIESHKGYVFKTVGDAFCAVFSSPFDALAAAEAVQRQLIAEHWPQGAELRARVALHTGFCEPRDGDYFGPVVNMVARLEATAHGGQVVCSKATAELLGRHLADSSLALVELGRHELAGIGEPVEIHQVTFSGLRSAFPPLRAPRTVPRTTNLPAARSSFVGRSHEVDEVVAYLRDHHLVTLTGAGGVGKSRLAIEVGRRLLDEATEGVWLVELAAITDARSVPAAVLAQLSVTDQPGREAADVLVDTLRDQQRVVLLDNCDHLIDACAELCDAISSSCPAIRIVATSREPLRVEGEQLFRVPPLSLPPEDVIDLDDLAGSEAVELFVERATAQNPGFQVRPQDARALASICRRLDGMPLALELATARLRADSLEQLDRRLDQRFKVLTRGSKSALPRQQTLRALIDWSYELLDADEAALFIRLSVFSGGFDLEAAAATCALDSIDSDDVGDLVESLVDKSLVTADVDRAVPRYGLLESLRQYGREQLEKADEEGGTALVRRLAASHAEYFAGLYASIADALDGPDASTWIARGREEQDNLRAACESLLAGEDAGEAPAAVAAAMLGATAAYADSLRDYRGLLRLIDESLRLAGSAADAVRGAALYCRARVAIHRDEAGLMECLASAAAAAHAAGDHGTEACATSFLAARRGDTARAAEVVELARGLGHPTVLALTLNRLGLATIIRGDSRTSIPILEESLEISRKHGDAELETLSRLALCAACIELGEHDLARAQVDAMTALFDDVPPPLLLTCPYLINLGWVELAEDSVASAERRFTEALRRSRLSGATRSVPDALLGLERCALLEGDPERAAMLLGAADVALAAIDAAFDAASTRIRAEDEASLRAALGPSFDACYATAQGYAMERLLVIAVVPGVPQHR